MDDESGESMEPIGNESVPNIIINATISLLFKAAVSILVISKHKSFSVLFDKIASIYLKTIFLYFSIGNGQPRKPALCQLYRHIVVPYGGSAIHS